MWAEIFNLINYLVGAGILGIPYAFAQVGIVGGGLLLLCCTLAILLSLFFLVSVSANAGVYSYEGLSKLLHAKAAPFVSLVIILDTIGTMAAYIRILIDAAHSFSPNFKMLWIWPICALFILPWMIFNDLRYLAWSSAISLVPTLLLVCALAWQVYIAEHQQHPELFADQPAIAFPIMIFGLYCHVGVPAIFQQLRASQLDHLAVEDFELKQPNASNNTASNNTPLPDDLGKMKRIISISVSISAIAYLWVGVSGLIVFGSDTKPNVLSSFMEQPISWTLVATNSFAILIGFPIVLFACRLSFAQLLPCQETACARFLQSTLLLLLSLIIGTFIPTLTDILGLSGSLFKTLLAFVLPPVFYIRLASATALTPIYRGAAYLLLIVGGIAGIVSFIFTLLHIIA